MVAMFAVNISIMCKLAQSLCCIPEANVILYVTYTQIKKKLKTRIKKKTKRDDISLSLRCVRIQGENSHMQTGRVPSPDNRTASLQDCEK